MLERSHSVVDALRISTMATSTVPPPPPLPPRAHQEEQEGGVRADALRSQHAPEALEVRAYAPNGAPIVADVDLRAGPAII